VITLHDIVRRVGGSIYSGGSRALVPGPDHSKSDRSLSLFLSGDRVIWHSYANDPVDAIYKHLGISAEPESYLSKQERSRIRRERREWELAERYRKMEFCRALWNRATAATNSAAHAYLRSRSIAAATLPNSLRYLAATPRGYKKLETAPAMLALVSDADGAPSGLHITFLKKDGHAGRIMVGSIMGGAVRLYEARDQLAVCEGIETALSYASLKSAPTWAVLSTSGLSNFRPPLSVDSLTLAIDRDDISSAHPRGAALEIAEKLSFPWCAVNFDPAPENLDWNDVLKAQK
jgi:putative DNA primase/helicase